MSEKAVQTNIMLSVSRSGATIFRNNQGRGVLGQIQKLPNGDFIVKNARVVDFGVCNPGGSDLIGWRTITITPDMVGKQAALFLALEVKTDTGKATKDQVNFIEAVRRAGGLAGVVRTADEAIGVCNPLL